MDAMISVNRHSTVAVKVRLIYGMAVYTTKKLAIILKLEQPFIYTLKTRSPGGTFSQIHVLVGDGGKSPIAIYFHLNYSNLALTLLCGE